MRIPPEKLEEIAAANDIVEVVSDYISVKKRGKSFLALCPFHPDKNPSLHISQEKQVYHCFSCKAGGNVFSFVQNYEKIGFIEAAEKLAEKAGIKIAYEGKGFDTSNELSELLEINRAAADYFRKTLVELRGSEGEFVRTYLKQRNIDEDTAEEFGIGYSLNRWDGLVNHFLEEGTFTVEQLERAGLVVRKEGERDSEYDRFRGRLMFPVYNESGKVVAFGGRKLYEDDPLGKYINSPETRLYNKSRILYGLNFAKDKIKFSDSVILVEGYMDLISMHRHGIKNVVASSGTALTEEQVKLISRYTRNVYVLYDADEAGVNAARRGAGIILQGGLDLKVVALSEGEDPDSFLTAYGKEDFEKNLANSKSLIDFVSEVYRKQGKLESAEGKAEFVRELVSVIAGVPDKLKRIFLVKELSAKYNLYESDLTEELEIALKKARPSFPRSSLEIPETRGTDSKRRKGPKGYSVHELELLRVFLRGNEDAVAYIENNLETTFIENSRILSIVEALLDEGINHGKIELSRVLNSIEDEEAQKLLMDAVSDKHESSYFEDSTFDSLLEESIEPEYELSCAVDVIRQLKLDMYMKEREMIKSGNMNPEEKLIKIMELNRSIRELNSR